MRRHFIFMLLLTTTLPSACNAAITIDGSRDTEYGSPLAVQTIQTGFGNANDPTGLGGGGELDAAYAVIEDRRLYVMITGNIENNFNKFHLFFDTKAGGENTLSSTPLYDFENISQNLGGFTFDSGFDADYHLYARWGSFTGNKFTVDIIERAGGTNATVRGNGDDTTSSDGSGAGTGIQHGIINPTDLGLGSTGVGEVRNLTPFLSSPIVFGFNNTNTAGVGGSAGSSADQVAAAAVTTGFEFSLDLADLGNPVPGQELKFHASYGNSNNNFHSNQSLGGLPAGTGNLGGNGSGSFTGTLSGIDYNNFSGDQFFSITVPGIPGDFNFDNQVDGADYLKWARGEVGSPPSADNLASWQDNFGSPGLAQSNEAFVTIPEPASLVTLMFGGLLFAARNRHSSGCSRT